MWSLTPQTSSDLQLSRRNRDAWLRLNLLALQDELDTMLADPRIAEKKMPILCRAKGESCFAIFMFVWSRFLNNKVDQPAASPPQETMQVRITSTSTAISAHGANLCSSLPCNVLRIISNSCGPVSLWRQPFFVVLKGNFQRNPRLKCGVVP